MSSKQDRVPSDFEVKLQDFERLLKGAASDQAALQSLFRTIRELLSARQESEADIRRVLDACHADEEIDDNAYLTVKRMLDRVVFDFHATMPDGGDADHARTDVIAKPIPEPENLAERLQAGSVLRDRFLLQRKVAGGSMGVVYKALDRRLAEVDEADPWVAIKVLTPKLSRNADALRAMQQEAAKGRCLMHPNIVRFVDLDREDDLYFIVMEWIEGRSLAAMLDNPDDNPLDLNASLRIVRQIGRALDYAHRCGVVHADVKPGNVMVLPDGNVKLIDFGVARIRQKQKRRSSKFDPGVLGAATPAYSSMQVLTGDEPVPTDDVFSLGCLLYRLLAGHRVFGPRNAAEAAEEGMVPQRPPGLNGRQWRALKKALAFSRVARHPTPKAFVDDLCGESVAEAPVAVAVDQDDVHIDRFETPKTRRWPVFAGMLAVIAGVGFVGTQTDYLDGTIATLTAAIEGRTREAGDNERVAATTAPVLAGAEESPIDSPLVADAGQDTPEDTVDRPANDLVEEALPSGAAPAADASAEAADHSLLADERADEFAADFAANSDALAEEEVDTSAAAPLAEDALEARTPTHTISLARAGDRVTELDVVLREDGEDAVIEVLRTTGTGLPLALRLEEVGFSGNRSPWETGQYRIANNGRLSFAAGQTTAQTSISMMSDPLREPDRQVNLVIRELDTPDAELALVNLILEDDDQRNFEGGLSPNTVAFAVSQVSVAEADPAVQIDVLRFNPDSQAVEVRYEVQDVTATEGEDYFAPRLKVLSFAPGQRTARLFIPLVQDAAFESDEAFFLEIDGRDFDPDADIFRRIAVMIRDDDS